MSGMSRQTAHKRLARPARRADGRQGLPSASYEGLGVVVECVMTDNGPAYRSSEFNALLEAHGMGHKYTRPFSPWQNGRVEHMNRTIAREWQPPAPGRARGVRTSALAPFIDCYNWDRPHSACGDLPPMSRIVGVNNVLAHNS